jgi:hypothetical protein
LLDGPECPQFASDAGTGLAAGAKAAAVRVHQLDWDHLLRPLWGQAARLERQAYAALQAVEERAAQFAAATTPKRLQQHLTKWDQLHHLAAEKVAQCDAFAQLARQVDDWFALIELSTGQLREVTEGIKQLQSLGEQLQGWSGRIYQKLATNLQNWAPGLFSYQPVLAEALRLCRPLWRTSHHRLVSAVATGSQPKAALSVGPSQPPRAVAAMLG